MHGTEEAENYEHGDVLNEGHNTSRKVRTNFGVLTWQFAAWYSAFWALLIFAGWVMYEFSDKTK